MRRCCRGLEVTSVSSVALYAAVEECASWLLLLLVAGALKALCGKLRNLAGFSRGIGVGGIAALCRYPVFSSTHFTTGCGRITWVLRV